MAGIKFGNNLKPEAVSALSHNPNCLTWIIDNAIFTIDFHILVIKEVT